MTVSTLSWTFGEADIDGLPEVVGRYLSASIEMGTPIATQVRMTMVGHIRLRRWLSYTATEVLDPHRGFEWSARVGRGLFVGADRYAEGAGSMEWRLGGILPVVKAGGPDVSRSAAGRAGAEAVLWPPALLPRFGVRWEGLSPSRAVAQFALDGTPINLRFCFGNDGLPTSIDLERWGDPDQSGVWGWHRFGGDLSVPETFGGITIPTVGAMGWRHGTSRFETGEFFRYRITDLTVDGRL